MAVCEISLLGNAVLRKHCIRVGRNITADDIRTIEDLRDTLANFRATHGFGRGIAAPQIGVAKRIVYVNMNRQAYDSASHLTRRVNIDDDGFCLIDAEIVKRSRQTMVLWDDCFSFPDILVKVRRSMRIEVKFRDAQGKTRHLRAEGDLSELLQHEIDHLNGILAIDQAIDSKHIVYRSEWTKQIGAVGKRTVL